MDKIWETVKTFTIAGNELWRPLVLFGVVLASFIAGRVIQLLLKRAGARCEAKNRAVTAVAFQSLAGSAVFFLFSIGLKLGIQFLVLPTSVSGFSVGGAVDTVTSITIALAIGWILYRLVDVVQASLEHLTKKTASTFDDMLVPLVRKSIRVTIAVLVLVQVAQFISEKTLPSIIAGLGVTGLAIGLAAKDAIRNFFGSILIFSDQPFQVGERIQVDDTDGSVEEVGFRSTRIRTLDGHLVTFPNGELANKAIRNLSKRPNIKRVLNLGLTYDTPPERVTRAIEILQELLKDHEGMDPDLPPRVVFNDFKETSLNILVIYWYTPPDYWAYCAFSQHFNLEVLRRFNEEGIEFAFPTQTVFVAGDPNRPFGPAAG